ncbi:unnamed protein product [Phytomonas sp. Hart1]|nr:unnamed protein product [Phytomonas sp. Hart1]|eukprot:CCW67491.1 unnamed protein product [Phytomonas sp. isolate Hart1]
MKKIVSPKRWSQLNHVEHPPLMMKRLVQAACGGLRWIETKNMAQYIARCAISEGFHSTQKQRKTLGDFPKKSSIGSNKQKVHQDAMILASKNQLMNSPAKRQRVILYDVLDCTFGSGYHSGAVLENGSPYTRVVALDCDVATRVDAREIVSEFGDDRFCFYCNRMSESLSMFGERSFDAIIIDPGPSVTQLEDPERGFLLDIDHCHDFDLRYAINSGLSALQYLNSVPQSTLSSALQSYGLLSPEQSIKMARAVRTGRPFQNSNHLLNIITAAGFGLPEDGWALQGSWKKASMSWKFLTSLRCIINNELSELAEAVKNAFLMLRNSGRLVVISRMLWEEEFISKFIQSHPHALLCYKEDIDLDDVQRYGHTRHTKMWVASRIDKSAYVLKNAASLTVEDVQKSSVQWMAGMFASQTHGFPADNFTFENMDAKERRIKRRNENPPPFDNDNDY